MLYNLGHLQLNRKSINLLSKTYKHIKKQWLSPADRQRAFLQHRRGKGMQNTVYSFSSPQSQPKGVHLKSSSTILLFLFLKANSSTPCPPPAQIQRWWQFISLSLPVKLRHRRKRLHNIKNTTIIDPLCFQQSLTQPISSLLIVACLITALTLLFVSSQIHPNWWDGRQSAMLF